MRGTAWPLHADSRQTQLPYARLRRIAATLSLAIVLCAVSPVLAQPGISRAGLAALFDPNSPAAAQVLAGYDQDGLAGAMAAYREYRQTLPPSAIPRVYMPVSDPVARADQIIAEGMRRAGYPPFSVKPPVDWGADPHGDRSWCYDLNTFNWLVPVLDAYRRTDDERYLQFAVSVIADWQLRNVVERAPNRFAWYDMAVGLRALRIAFTTDRAARSADVSDRDLLSLLETAVRHADELRDPANYAGDYNHGLYQMLGLLALARTLPELSGFRDHCAYAETRAERVFLRSFCPEGVHLEHSPWYHYALLRSLEVVMSSGLLQTPAIAELHVRAQRALAWFIHPAGHIARIGDSSYLEVGERSFPSQGAPRSPELLWALSKGQAGSPPDVNSAIFSTAGYAIFRSTWDPSPQPWESASYLVLMAGRHSRIHKHADDLSFEWSELGHALLTDAGMFRYWPTDLRRICCVSTRAHNTVEIDERTYPRPANTPAEPWSAITRWTEGEKVRAVEAEITHFGTVRHRRTLMFQPGAWLVVVDEMSAPNDHSYAQWFHFHPDLEVVETGDVYSCLVGDTGYQLFVRRVGPAERQRAILVKGEEEPRLNGWTSLETGAFVPSWALGFPARGRDPVLVTLFTLSSAKDPPKQVGLTVDDTAIHITWSQGGDLHGVRLTRSEGVFRVESGASVPTAPPTPPPVVAAPEPRAPSPLRGERMAVSLPAPLEQWLGRWNYRTEVQILAAEDGGLRLEVMGTEDTSAGQYAGVHLPVQAPRVLVLDVSLINPEDIQAVFVDGHDWAGSRVARWRWQGATESDRRSHLLSPSDTLMPDGSATQFVAEDAVPMEVMEAIARVEVAIRLRPRGRAGFVLHGATVIR